MNLFKET